MKCVLFDFGGTLDSDGITWLERFRVIYKDLGIATGGEDFPRAFYAADDELPARRKLGGLDLRDTVFLQAQGVLERLAPDRLPLAEAAAERFASESRGTFRKIAPVLDRLRSRFKLGVVSNFYGNLDGILVRERLSEYFHAVADSGVLGVSKPAPEIFLSAARRLGAAPEDCVMVGDSPTRDMAGAAAAGMAGVLVAAAQAPRTPGAGAAVRSVAELEEVLP